MALGRAYSVGSEPESENPLPQAYEGAKGRLGAGGPTEKPLTTNGWVRL
jgi:hypothetical protein